MTETPQQPTPQPAVPQPAPQPVAPQPTGPPQGNGLAVAGMVLGIIGLGLFCLWPVAIPCAIVGLILSVLGKKKSKITGTGGGMATTGLVLSIIALALDILFMILALSGAYTAMSVFEQAAEQRQISMLLLTGHLLSRSA